MTARGNKVMTDESFSRFESLPCSLTNQTPLQLISLARMLVLIQLYRYMETRLKGHTLPRCLLHGVSCLLSGKSLVAFA